MKAMFKSSIGLLLMVCASVIHVGSTTVRDSTDLTSAKPSDYRFLWYGQFVNEFDSARVRYIVGEFRLWDTLGTGMRLPIRLSDNEWQTDATILSTPIQYQGMGAARGVDSSLLDVIRTQTAIAKQGGTITFCTLASVEQTTNCTEGTFTPADTTAFTPHNYRDAQLALQNANAILDTTAFVVQLVNVTDMTIYTLDSICIMPNAGRMMPNTGTTDAATVNKSAPIPPSCWGDSVYLRIAAYRWGPTEFGMTASKVHYPTSVSTLYKELPTTYASMPRFLDTAFADSVHRWEYDDLVAYLSQDTNRNCLPIVFGGLTVSGEFEDELDSVILALGKQTTTYCDCLSEWKADSSVIGATLYPPVSFEKQGAIRNVSYQDGKSSGEQYFKLASYDFESSVTFEITANVGPCEVAFYDLTGRRLAILWEGETPHSGVLSVPNNAHGFHIVTLSSPRMHTTTAVKVMIR